MGTAGSKPGPPFDQFELQHQFLFHFGRKHGYLDALRKLDISRGKIPATNTPMQFPGVLDSLPVLVPRALSELSTQAGFTFIGLLCSTKIVRGVHSPSIRTTALAAAVLTVLHEVAQPLRRLISRGILTLRDAVVSPQLLTLYYGGAIGLDALISLVFAVVSLLVMQRLVPQVRISTKLRHVIVAALVALFRSRVLVVLPSLVRSLVTAAAAAATQQQQQQQQPAS
jgi:hypothetical protein